MKLLKIKSASCTCSHVPKWVCDSSTLLTMLLLQDLDMGDDVREFQLSDSDDGIDEEE